MAARAIAMSDDRSPAEIERDVDHTRVEIALTLDALERRLSARHLVEKGFDMLKETLGDNDAMNRSLDLIRANPIPVALMGIGAAWLIASNTNVVDRLARDRRIESARRRVVDMASNVGARAGELVSDVAGRVGIGSSGSSGDVPLGHTGNTMVDDTGRADSDGWVHQVADIAQGALRSARDSGEAMLSRAGVYAGDGAGRVADQVSDAFQRHPLVIGSIGVMAGALIAALLPATRVEDELLGDTRDSLWHKTQKAGEQALTQARDAATRAVDAASGAAADTVKNELDKSSQS
jgi:hypothetical protein